MATIVIYTSGTLGDHLPFIALGQALTKTGHRVRLAINQAMHPYAEQLGLEAIALTDIERGPEHARKNAWAWDFWNTQVQIDHPKAGPFDAKQFLSQAGELIALCRKADLLISTSIRTLGYVVYNALELPWITVSMNPYAFWQPGTAEEQDAKLRTHLKEYTYFKPILSYAFSELGIRKTISSWSEGWLFAKHVILASSPHFSRPDLNQFQPHCSIDMTGFWFYEDPSWKDWQPDEALRRFCERRPMVLSFSSQPLENPAQALEIHIKAAARLNRPLLIQRGWAGFSEADLPPDTDPENILFADFLPHDWLFAQASCAIQHGGIGSIARALRQGCPLLIEPYGNDQIYNASRVAGNLKVGAAMHPFKMTVDGLVQVLEENVLTSEYRQRAQALGEKIGSENGLENACQLIEAYLNQQQRPGHISTSYAPYTFQLHALSETHRVHAKEGDQAPPAIPKILHQTWKDTFIPPALARFQRTWKMHHPDCAYLLWTDADNRKFIRRHYPWFLHIYDSYPEHIMRVDAIRYFLLYHYGGVYVDLDFECVKPLGPLLRGKQIVLGTEPDAQMNVHFPTIQPFRKTLCNAFMASQVRHPFWAYVFKQLIAHRRAPDPLDATGRFFLTRAYNSYQAQETISIVSEDLLYPITIVENQTDFFLDPVERVRIAQNAYGIHHWSRTWRQESRTTRAEQVKVSILSKGEPVETTSLFPLEEYRLQLQQLPNLPRVSCSMVAHNQVEVVQRSIHCFQRQTYPQKELIIIDVSGHDTLAQWVEQLHDERIIYMQVSSGDKSQEELWATAAARASGEYIARWGVKDLSEPRRLEVQMAAIEVLKTDACFLERQQFWWLEKHRLAFSARRIWESSLVCTKEKLLSCSAEDQNEDTALSNDIIKSSRIALVDFPQLYTTMLHKDTPLDPDIWEKSWQEATEFYDHEIYEIIVQHIQNGLGLDLSAWIGQQPVAADGQSSMSSSTEQVPEERQFSIPKILHQTWKDARIPSEFEAFQRSWQTHHPDWIYCLWTDVELREFIRRHYAWFLPIYDQYPEQIKRVDVVRYFILFHYGGVYVDLDFECLQPIDSLLAAKQVVFGLEPPPHLDLHFPKERGLKQIICNAFMASVPGHPFWEHVFKQLIKYHRAPGPLDATGPFLLTRAYESYAQQDTISIVAFDLIYPVSSEKPWDEISPEAQTRITERAYAIHHWRGTWWRETAAKQIQQVKVSLLVQGKSVTVSTMQIEQIKTLFSQQSELPRISCLMVTKNRSSLAQRAIRCFQQQTYQNRELLIVDDGEDDTLKEWTKELHDDRIVYVRLPAENQTLGELRNIAVERASGTYVTQWDDDDLSDPERLHIQLAVIHSLQTDACFLERQQIWWPESRRFTISSRRMWEGSFVCAKAELPPYPAQPQGEDTPVIEHIVRNGRIALLDLPQLYTYIFHGANTFDAEHWEAHWLAATESYEGDMYDIKLRELKSRLQFDLLPQPEYASAMPELGDEASMPKSTTLPFQETHTTVTSTAPPKILILTPVKDAVAFLPHLWENLNALTYSHERISLAFLESDSIDNTYGFIEQHLLELQAEFAKVSVFKRDYAYRSSLPRWEASQQFKRRSIMAKSRNYLLSAALEDEEWVLWIDVDVARWPDDVIEQLLTADKDIVVPNCLSVRTGATSDYNTFKLKPGAETIDWSPYIVDGILQPPKGYGRLYLSDLRQYDCVEIDAVGGTMLLIRADLHREGLIFPPFSYKLHIETEGLALMAKDLGYQSWGLPNLKIFHP